MIALALLLQAISALPAECRAPSAECRVTELRKLGRSESAAAVPRIAAFLKDPNPAIQSEAIWALAQAAKDPAAADGVLSALGTISALGTRHSALGTRRRGAGGGAGGGSGSRAGGEDGGVV